MSAHRERTALAWSLVAAGIVALLALAGLATLALRAPAPRPALATRPLPDGTTLNLVAATYGKRHEYSETPPPSGPLAWLRRPQGRSLSPAVVHTSRDAPVFWFSRRLAPGGVMLGFEWWTDIEAVDEHGCRFGNVRRQLVADGPHGSYGKSGGEGTPLALDPGYGSFTRILGTAELPSFPRRSATVRLRLYGEKGKEVAPMEAPNPAAGAFPTWSPEPIPATRRDGDVSITLASLSGEYQESWSETRTAKRPALLPTWRIRQGGRESREWGASDVRIADATGNEVSPWACYLCHRESVWEIRARFWRTPDARFSPGELWTVPGIPLPRSRQVLPLGGSATVDGVRLELIAVAGAGVFRYRNTVPEAAPLGGETLASLASIRGISVGGSSWTDNGVLNTDNSVRSGRPHVSLRVHGLSEDQRLSLRGSDERGRRFFSGNSATMGEEHYLELPVPQGARRLSLTFMVHRCRSAAFRVRPPRFTTPTRRAGE